MTVPRHAAPALDRLHSAPADIAAIGGWPAWRDACAWPLPYAELRRAMQELLARYMGFIAALDDGQARDVAILAGHAYLSVIGPAVAAALAVEAEADSGLRLDGEAPEFAFLRGEGGGEGADRPPRLLGSAHLYPIAAPRYVWARRLARVKSWATWTAMPVALVAPRHVAISHNAHLRRRAAAVGRVGFRHAESILASARRRSPPTAADAVADAAARVVAAVEGPGPAVRARLEDLAQNEARPLFARAARDVAGLARLARLPMSLWAGSGGYWPSRAVGLEVLRRGGEVTRFSHNGCDALVADRHNTLALIELSNASRYVLGAHASAELARRSGAADPVASYRRIALDHGDGLPPFDVIAPRRDQRARARRRVLFAPTVIVGQRSLFPPLLPDVVALDWQLRLAEALRALPVELLCKPHPEGLFAGRRQPIADVAPVSSEPFEAHLDWAEMFVFDRGESTTFWEALCTDRPVVYLDLGLTEFAEPIKPLIAARCRTVSVAFDGRNLPQFDPEALASAIVEAPAEVDPMPLRRYLAGEE